MKTLKKNNISQESAINSPVPVNKNCELPPFFNEDYFGHVVVQTFEELESIPCKLRQDGMVATVVQESYSDYQLQTSRTGFGICDNNAWVKVSIGDEVFSGGNLFLFQTEEQASRFMSSTQSKKGQVIYVSDLDRYFKFDGQDGLTDAFPGKLDKPTVQGSDNQNYKIPAYLDDKPYWRSSSDFNKVKSVNGKIDEVVLKTSDLENDSDYTTNSKLNKEVQDRIAQINDVEQKIQTEKTERISEDNILDGKITIEEAERINADGLKLDKPLENATDQYVILGDGTTSPKSDFGKVNTVNDIPPDENKNVNIGLNDTLKIGNETDKTISFLQSIETDDHQMHLDAIRGIDISKSEINSYDSYRNININYKGISLLGDNEIGSGIMSLGLNEDLNQYEVKLTSRYNGRKLDFGFIDKIGSSYYGFSNTNGSYKIVPKNYDPVGNYTATLPDKSGIIAFTSDIQSPTIGSINPTTDTTDLIDGVYNTQIPGTYTNAGNIVVKEGYYTLLRKDNGVWKLESEVKMPTLSAEGKVEQGNTEAVSGGEVYNAINDIMLMSEQYGVLSTTLNSDGIISNASIKWEDGVTGTLTFGDYNSDWLAYDSYTITYQDKIVTQPKVTRDSNGTIIISPLKTIS